MSVCKIPALIGVISVYHGIPTIHNHIKKYLYIYIFTKYYIWITTIIEGKTDRKAGRGRPRTTFMKQIIEDIGKTNYKKLKVAVT